MSRKFHYSNECIENLKHFWELFLHRKPEKTEPGYGTDGMAPLGPAASVVPMAVVTGNDAVENEPENKEPEQNEKLDIPVPEPVKDTEWIVCRTDVGMVRTSNQDSLVRGDHLFGIADGMGGHNGGEVASQMTSALMVEKLKEKQPSADGLNDVVREVNSVVFQYAEENSSLMGMGTTLTCAWFNEEDIFIGHVGDSRAYRLRDGEFRQMTADHSYVGELVRQGLITKEQAECHPMRNVITRAVGTEEQIDVDVLWNKRRPGDRWLICSDGLYGMVKEEQLAELMKIGDIAKAADELLQAALDGGGRDNITLVLFDDREGAV